MKTLKLRSDYEQKLIELKVKKRFMDNLKASCVHHEELNEVINYINEAPSFSLFVTGAFDFEKAIEGKEFWKEISKL